MGTEATPEPQNVDQVKLDVPVGEGIAGKILQNVGNDLTALAQYPETSLNQARVILPEVPTSTHSLIAEICRGIKVNHRTARTGIVTADQFCYPIPVVSQAINKTGVRKLIDLCCGGYSEFDEDSKPEEEFIHIGITQYVGVDVNEALSSWSPMTYTSKVGELNQTFQYEYIREEALTFLSGQPDNSSHIMMCGLEHLVLSGSKIREWSEEIFKHMKRVAPDGGIICLQEFIFNQGVCEQSTLYDALKEIHHKRDIGGISVSKAALVDRGLEKISDGYPAYYRFKDEKLGCDWCLESPGENEKTVYLRMVTCQGRPMWLVNRKNSLV